MLSMSSCQFLLLEFMKKYCQIENEIPHNTYEMFLQKNQFRLRIAPNMHTCIRYVVAIQQIRLCTMSRRKRLYLKSSFIFGKL